MPWVVSCCCRLHACDGGHFAHLWPLAARQTPLEQFSANPRRGKTCVFPTPRVAVVFRCSGSTVWINFPHKYIQLIPVFHLQVESGRTRSPGRASGLVFEIF